MARSGQASAQGSAIIGDLAARQSVLPTVGPYADVAQAVIEANAGPARAELRVARLRAEARSQNWLPTLSPTLSLTDLGEAAASLLLEQVLFDGGPQGRTGLCRRRCRGCGDDAFARFQPARL
ncbi:hypothetical protein ACFSHQ_05770 [Gemmobacter lanyuensis]